MKEPLVSIAVITYNSSRTVIETLDSIKAQTYPNIELIISDDCSKDDTVAKCQKWVKQNKDQFVRTEIVAVDANSGVSANFNRGEAACRGEWIKPIAGDDVLMPDCIHDNMQFVQENPKAKYVFSRIEPFGNDAVAALYEGNAIFDYTLFEKSTEEQLNAFVLDDKHIPAPTLFFNRLYAIEKGIVNDERMPLIEDEPKWINVLKSGTRLYFFDKVTVKYRVGDVDALSSPTHVFSPRQFESICRFYFYYKFPARYERNPEQAMDRMIDLIIGNYQSAYELGSGRIPDYPRSYKVFMKLWQPIRYFKRKLRELFRRN